jgi:hypothetical protein
VISYRVWFEQTLWDAVLAPFNAGLNKFGQPMVRALESRWSQSPKFLIINLLDNQNTAIYVLIGHIFCTCLLTTPKHGTIFDDLVAKLGNDVPGKEVLSVGSSFRCWWRPFDAQPQSFTIRE